MSVLLQTGPGDAGEPVKDFRDTNLPLVILEELKDFLEWKKSQWCHGERQQHRIFFLTHKMDQVLAGMADNSQVSALLVAGVKNVCGNINCYQH